MHVHAASQPLVHRPWPTNHECPFIKGLESTNSTFEWLHACEDMSSTFFSQYGRYIFSHQTSQNAQISVCNNKHAWIKSYARCFVELRPRHQKNTCHVPRWVATYTTRACLLATQSQCYSVCKTIGFHLQWLHSRRATLYMGGIHQWHRYSLVLHPMASLPHALPLGSRVHERSAHAWCWCWQGQCRRANLRNFLLSR